MNDSEREALKQEIRDEMARQYGPALALVQQLTRFRRHVEADGVDLPRRRNVFLGTTMKLLGNAKIEDEDGSYWDKTGIHLVAADEDVDSLSFWRTGFDAAAGISGLMSSTLGWLRLYALSPDNQNYLYADLKSSDTDADLILSISKSLNGSASGALDIYGSGDVRAYQDLIAVRDAYARDTKPLTDLQKSTGSATTVTNTTTETTVFSQSVAANALASQVSGSAVWNRGLRFVGYGFYQNDKGSNGTLTIRVKLGSTTLLTGTWTQGDINTDAYLFRLEVNIWALSSSAVLAVLHLVETSRAAPTGDVYGSMDPGSANSHGILMDKSVSIDLTSTQTFSITFQMDAANATYTNELTAGTLQRI
ncbi:MAG: hypothetical protein KDI19_16765 [Pseudomonadales bacterium]|nr:hypothetical protein [Pseudomonadales bacterium]